MATPLVRLEDRPARKTHGPAILSPRGGIARRKPTIIGHRPTGLDPKTKSSYPTHPWSGAMSARVHVLESRYAEHEVSGPDPGRRRPDQQRLLLLLGTL